MILFFIISTVGTDDAYCTSLVQKKIREKHGGKERVQAWHMAHGTILVTRTPPPMYYINGVRGCFSLCKSAHKGTKPAPGIEEPKHATKHGSVPPQKKKAGALIRRIS